jgi:predicted secreted hydrolase
VNSAWSSSAGRRRAAAAVAVVAVVDRGLVRGRARGGGAGRVGVGGAARLVLAAGLVAAACAPGAPPAAPPSPLSLTALLAGAAGADGAGGADGFARALEPRPFTFPDDHGPHPRFRSEWWYFTGILRADAGPGVGPMNGPPRRFGYQLTIFRQALAGAPAARPSRWATRDVYMAHLAISDIDGAARGGASFQADQRFSRDGLALAGATARPFAVWVDGWSMRGPASGSTSFPIALRARGGDAARDDALELTVEAGRGPIPEGDGGLSAKGPRAGQASYYYSCTRLPTHGRLTVHGETFDVTGASWLDREWSTDSLGPEVAGWDWLGVHLSDGRDLMIYRLRGQGGAPTAESRATLIGADGQTRRFAPPAFTLTATDSWVSPHTAVRYPAALRLQIPSERLDVTARPLLADQELRLAVRYWEGAVTVAGSQAGAPLGGDGYLELTGYGTQE